MSLTASKSRTQEVAMDLRSRAEAFAQTARKAAADPRNRATVASAATGTVLLGVGGGALGLAIGGTIGAAVGVPFAFFTFGLSIPFSSAVGGVVGGGSGAVLGGGTGCAIGGFTGFIIFTKRLQIVGAFTLLGSRITDVAAMTVAYGFQAVEYTTARVTAGKDLVKHKTAVALSATMIKTSELTQSGVQVAKNPHAQVTAASAAAGGVAVGVGGGAVGLVGGGILGAVVGIVPAFLTFGLSIPIFTMIGGGTGFCVGTIVGSTTGAVGGGAVGYGAYDKRTEIHNGATGVAAYVRQRALALKAFVEFNITARSKADVQEVACAKSPKVETNMETPKMQVQATSVPGLQTKPVMMTQAVQRMVPSQSPHLSTQAADATSPKRSLKACEE